MFEWFSRKYIYTYMEERRDTTTEGWQEADLCGDRTVLYLDCGGSYRKLPTVTVSLVTPNDPSLELASMT